MPPAYIEREVEMRVTVFGRGTKRTRTVKMLRRLMLVVPCLILAALAFLYFVPDYNFYLVMSESMEPEIDMGDLVITGPVDGPLSRELAPGTVITYQQSGELVTHRIKSIDGAAIVTQGDAVEDPDPWTVNTANIQGVYMFKIPYVGYLTNFVQTKTGWLLTILVPAAVLVLWLVKDIVKEALKPDDFKPDEKNAEYYLGR